MVLQEFHTTPLRCQSPVRVWSALMDGTKLLAGMGIESARLDAEVLLAAVLGSRRENLYVRSEPLTENEQQHYQELLFRRARREPVAYIVGMREFWSLDFSVMRGVFIPRPETELLVELTLRFLPAQRRLGTRTIRLLDLCTGSGAIAVSLAKERIDLEIWGTDVAPESVRIAELNAARHGMERKCRFLRGDLFAPVTDRSDFFEVIVSNPPYVPHREIERLPVDVRNWEPTMALDGGVDGLDFYRNIIGQTPSYLRHDGFLLLEIGADLETKVATLIAGSGQYRDCEVHRDYSGRARVVSARKIPSRQP